MSRSDRARWAEYIGRSCLGTEIHAGVPNVGRKEDEGSHVLAETNTYKQRHADNQRCRSPRPTRRRMWKNTWSDVEKVTIWQADGDESPRDGLCEAPDPCSSV